jgi:hypothetical protein
MKNKTLLITIAFFVFSSAIPAMAKNKGKHHDNGKHYGQQHNKKGDRDDDYYDKRHYDDDYRNRQTYRIEKPVDNLIDYSAEKLKREFK